MPSEEGYPVYQVFGIICSFYQYGITTPPGVLPLCLPKDSSNEVQNVVALAIHPEHPELKGLVNTIFKRGFEGLTTIHELIAQTAMTVKYSRRRGENLPYSCNSLEDHLRAAIQALDASEETHKRWVYHGLRLLAVNGQANLVRQVLNDYPNQIQSLQQGNKVTGWFTFARMYEAVGLLAERDRCLNAILSTDPESSWEWTYWLALIERCGTPEQKQQAIAQTSTWLQKHSEDTYVRTKYLALIGQCDTPEQKQQAIAQTSTWLQQHSEDNSVRTQYLALIGQCGTPEQKQQAIAQTSTWLQDYPKDSTIRTIYLAVVGKAGKDIIDVESIISQQWQWISQQLRVEQSLWEAFLPVLYHHAQPQLIQEAVNLALKQYPENRKIIYSILLND